MQKASAGALVFLLLAGTSVLAQSKADTALSPTFEVATIKPTAPNGKGAGVWSPPGIGSFWAKDLSLQFLIQMAFGVNSNEIAGKPRWLDSDYFDVTAKAEEGVSLSRAELRPRLQNLLQTRFHLATHYETRMRPGYALVVAKGEPKLRPTRGDRPPGFRLHVGPGRIEGINWTMDYLAAMLEDPAGRPVANKTGIAGSYDVKLEFTSDIETDSTSPSVFAALQENLGLELKAQLVPVQVLVIDHIENVPTGN